MCLLYFCPFKTALNKGSKEMQEDGRGCGGISCWAMSGPVLKLGSIVQGTGEHFLEAEGSRNVPFLLLPFHLMLSQLHFTVQGRNSLLLQSLGEHWKIPSCQSSSKKHKKEGKALNNEWVSGTFVSIEMLRPSSTGCISALTQSEWSHSLELNHWGWWW